MYHIAFWHDARAPVTRHVLTIKVWRLRRGGESKNGMFPLAYFSAPAFRSWISTHLKAKIYTGWLREDPYVCFVSSL